MTDSMSILERLSSLESRVHTLEARPQPVAVTPEVTDTMVNAYANATIASPLAGDARIRAGLTAALAAKEAGI